MKTGKSAYRYAFNGKENDKDFGTSQLVQDYGFRIYNPAIARFLSVDPLASSFPWYTPYQFAGNKPITYVDLDGAEEYHYTLTYDSQGNTQLDLKSVTYENNYSFLGLEFTQQVPERYVVETAGKTYYIGFYSGKGKYNSKDEFKRFASNPDDYEGEYGFGFENNFLSEGESWLVYGAEYLDHAGRLLEGAGGPGKMMHGRSVNKGKNPKVKIDCGCFTKGTEILTEEGHKEIQEIQEGDMVWAYDDKTGELALKEVTQTFRYVRDTVYKIHIGDEVIEATSDHPFFIGGKWLKVSKLSEGDSVQLYSGDKLVIKQIQSVPASVNVYNFTVDEYHTYYVSNINILVHNNDCWTFKGRDFSVTTQVNSSLKNKFDQAKFIFKNKNGEETFFRTMNVGTDSKTGAVKLHIDNISPNSSRNINDPSQKNKIGGNMFQYFAALKQFAKDSGLKKIQFVFKREGTTGGKFGRGFTSDVIDLE